MMLLVGPHLNFGNIALELAKVDLLLEPLEERKY
jgi:hypothetical protein